MEANTAVSLFTTGIANVGTLFTQAVSMVTGNEIPLFLNIYIHLKLFFRSVYYYGINIPVHIIIYSYFFSNKIFEI